jgi:hypothetical protein
MFINQAKRLYTFRESLFAYLAITWALLCVATAYLRLHTIRANCSTHTADVRYDTDSFLLGIDNHASASMTYSKDNFIGPTKTLDIKIKSWNSQMENLRPSRKKPSVQHIWNIFSKRLTYTIITNPSRETNF